MQFIWTGQNAASGTHRVKAVAQERFAADDEIDFMLAATEALARARVAATHRVKGHGVVTWTTAELRLYVSGSDRVLLYENGNVCRVPVREVELLRLPAMQGDGEQCPEWTDDVPLATWLQAWARRLEQTPEARQTDALLSLVQQIESAIGSVAEGRNAP